jgi:hypothetical protein
VIISDRSLEAQWETANLKQALANKDSWTEIRFRKQFVTKLAAVTSSAVKRRSATFLELAKLAIKTDTFSGRIFEHEKRTIAEADYGKTLTEVSTVLATLKHCGQSTNVCILACL